MSEKIHARSLPIFCVLWALALPTQAQVVKQREFKLNAPRDRANSVQCRRHFPPATFCVGHCRNSSGEWQLYRVKNWLNSSPLEEKTAPPWLFLQSGQKGFGIAKCRRLRDSEMVPLRGLRRQCALVEKGLEGGPSETRRDRTT